MGRRIRVRHLFIAAGLAGAVRADQRGGPFAVEYQV